jgi:hypothetical protein
MMHFYVFTWHKGDSIPTYERTCGTLRVALQRVRESGRLGFVSVDCLPFRFWY